MMAWFAPPVAVRILFVLPVSVLAAMRLMS